MSKMQPADMKDWMQNQSKRAVSNDARGRGPAAVLGTVDPWWSSGLPKVLIDGEPFARGTGYPWDSAGSSNWAPKGGDRVYLIPSARTGYIIAGLVKESHGMNVFPFAPYVSTVNFGQYDTNWHELGFTSTDDGITIFQGMGMAVTATIGSNGKIGTLPAQFRPHGLAPTERLRFPISVADNATAVDIYGNGDITLAAGATVGQFVSLQGVMFPNVQANATWTPIAATGSPASQVQYGTNWSRFTDATFVVPRYWVDSYGITWFQGMLTVSSALPADNTPMVILPAGIEPVAQSHFLQVAQGTYQTVGADNGAAGHGPRGINYKAGGTHMTVGGAMSICIAMPLASSPLVWTAPSFVNSWTTYGGITMPSGWTDRNGLTLFRGLNKGGAVNTVMFNLPVGHRPYSYQGSSNSTSGILQNRPASDARGRIDVYGNGDVKAAQGTMTWFSFDGFALAAEH